MQGLNTTQVHGHAALFGVYGMLGIGLILFCLRALRPNETWREGKLRFAFWAINGGFMAMLMLSLLPVGLMRTGLLFPFLFLVGLVFSLLLQVICGAL